MIFTNKILYPCIYRKILIEKKFLKIYKENCNRKIRNEKKKGKQYNDV